MNTLDIRLDKLRTLIQDQDFLEGKGLSHDVNIRIFCYAPKDEIRVRHFVAHQLRNDKEISPPILECNLYHLFIEICQDMDILDGITEMEQEDGSVSTLEQLHSAIGEDEFIEKLKEKAQDTEYGIMLLTGVGDVFPFIRVHKLLTSMQPYFSDKPIIVLYPGVFDGNAFKLFHRLQPNSHYHAFSVI